MGSPKWPGRGHAGTLAWRFSWLVKGLDGSEASHCSVPRPRPPIRRPIGQRPIGLSVYRLSVQRPIGRFNVLSVATALPFVDAGVGFAVLIRPIVFMTVYLMTVLSRMLPRRGERLMRAIDHLSAR